MNRRQILVVTVLQLLFAEHLYSQTHSPINTETDPAYEYEYKASKFVPAKGKTLLIMGQTKEGIEDYQALFSEEKKPAGWSAYWGMSGIQGGKHPAQERNRRHATPSDACR